MITKKKSDDWSTYVREMIKWPAANVWGMRWSFRTTMIWWSNCDRSSCNRGSALTRFSTWSLCRSSTIICKLQDHRRSSAIICKLQDHQPSSASFNILTILMCSSYALSAMISTELLSKYSDQNDNAQTWNSSALSGKQQLGWNNARAIYFTNKPQFAHPTHYSRSNFHAWTPHNTISNHQHVYEQIL